MSPIEVASWALAIGVVAIVVITIFIIIYALFEVLSQRWRE